MGAIMPLSSLISPTLQSLINMGTSPVAVGNAEFSNFSLINALPGTGVSASQIQVQPYTTGGDGLQFVSSWSAANGSEVDEVISFDVQTIDSTKPITQISLLSNGTAPVPTTGTFASTTLISQLLNGAAAAPVISTYNDGVTMPIDTTKPDINYAQTTLAAQTQLHIIDTLFEDSTAPGTTTSGGVATESVVQNSFVSVPEPAGLGLILLPIGGFIGAMARRGRLT